MSWMADAHREWHYVNGQVPCPLDCGIGDAGCPGCGEVDCRGCEDTVSVVEAPREEAPAWF